MVSTQLTAAAHMVAVGSVIDPQPPVAVPGPPVVVDRRYRTTCCRPRSSHRLRNSRWSPRCRLRARAATRNDGRAGHDHTHHAVLDQVMSRPFVKPATGRNLLNITLGPRAPRERIAQNGVCAQNPVRPVFAFAVG